MSNDMTRKYMRSSIDGIEGMSLNALEQEMDHYLELRTHFQKTTRQYQVICQHIVRIEGRMKERQLTDLLEGK